MVAISVHAAPAPDLIAQIHFAGAQAVSADTNVPAFTNLWCSTEAQTLRVQTLDKLARAPYAWFKSKLPPGAGDGAAQLRPLLDDLLSAEWLLQIRDATNGSPEYALAIRLDAGRAQLWQTNLSGVLEAWTGMSVTKNTDGWELKKHLPPNRVRFVRVGDWVVFGWGQDELPLNNELVRRVASEKRPAPLETNAWLAADLDWPRLARWFPSVNPFDLPETQLRLIGRDRNLRLDGKLIFPQPPALKLEAWRIPTNTIHQPFISFAAVRGIAPWLEKQGWAQAYGISPAPNQAFIWALAGMPLQTFVALPVPDAKNAIGQFEQKLSAHTGWQDRFMTKLTMERTNNQLSWIGLPYIAPKLEALHEPSGDYLFASVFPNTPRGKPLPPELLALLGESNLVYYHWEVTSERLKMLPHLTQLALMVTRHRQLDAQSAAGKWLAAAGPALGASVTEVRQTAPDQLTFKRRAPAGLTAIELTALASWLEATNFPGCDLRLPPPKPRRPHPKIPAATPAQTHAASPAMSSPAH